VSYLKTQFSDDRAKRCRNIFSTILDFAVECKYLSENPFERKIVSNCIKFDTTPVSNKTYTTREVKILLDNSKGWFNLFLEVLFKTGMRVGEAKGIQWSDIDFATGQLKAKRSITHGVITNGDTATKKHERTIHLYPSLFEKLKSFYEIRESNQWVFTNKEGSFIGENHVLLNQLKQLCQEMGIEYKTLKPTRRSYASIVNFSGVSIEKVQEDIGHSKGSNVTPKHYIDRSVLELSQEQKIALKQEELFLSMVG
jgi:integrase